MSSPLQPQLVKDIDAAFVRIQASDPSAAGPHWGAMHKLLLKAKIDPQAIMRLVGARDIAELTRAVARAKGEEVAESSDGASSDAGASNAEGTTANAAPSQEFELSVLQDALRMFRKRVKLSQLDADSKLGVGPMSGTGQHRIQGMLPPRDFPWAVWEALVKAGKLRRDADGFYSIVEQPGGAHW
ncbi:MAG: hypothetical protein DWH89_03890 [Planctomycetota bacterium]|nr:MAG: hypothetical protein DWH89_03890 [Planctomycetota bacterium]RLS52584.1 MAG: hypothetical protein DWH92_01655 [Planctomycetota bacterium]HAQ66172.1 hypothetical protein [Phycisphaerales bacterium]